MIQIAFGVVDEHYKYHKWLQYLYLPLTPITREAKAIHHFTKAKLKSARAPDFEVKDALMITKLLNSGTDIVGHNIKFDITTLRIEFKRVNMEHLISDFNNQICTIKVANELHNRKWNPSLRMLCIFYLTSEPLDYSKLHDAEFDLEATGKCFIEMRIITDALIDSSKNVIDMK